jgi:hypothetical protein
MPPPDVADDLVSLPPLTGAAQKWGPSTDSGFIQSDPREIRDGFPARIEKDRRAGHVGMMVRERHTQAVDPRAFAGIVSTSTDGEGCL